MMRRAELQHKYDGVLQWSIPRYVSMIISDYQRQEAILEWIVENKKLFFTFRTRVWVEFLDYVEKHPDIPLTEMLDTFKDGYPLLEGHSEQRFWECVRLLKTPGGLEKTRHERMSFSARAERNKDALCWTCTNLDYDPIYDHAMSQSVPVAGLWDRDTSILDHDPVVSLTPMNCYTLPVCPVRGVVIHKGYKHCLNYSELSNIKKEEVVDTQGGKVKE